MGYGVDSIGQINAAGLLAFALFSPAAGHWARRAGCRRVLVGGAALMAAGYLLMSLAGFLPGSVRAGWIVSVKVVISCGFAAYMVNSSPFLMQEWGETRMPEGAHYEQEQQILKTEVRGNMAISVVRESGRWRSDSGEVYVRWDDTRNVWFTGRIKGEWKIIAAFFPEVTPRTQS